MTTKDINKVLKEAGVICCNKWPMMPACVHCEVLKRLQPLFDQAKKAGAEEERQRWINQPANAHDEEIRKVERAELVQAIEGLKRNPKHLVSEADADFGYNEAILDIISLTQAKGGKK